MWMIKAKTEKLIRKFKTNNPFKIIENYKNILVYKVPLKGNVRGLYQYQKGIKFIFVNNSLSEPTQNMVCAHELGHAVLHTRLNACFFKENTLFIPDKFETQANKFAAELLLPDELVRTYFGYSLKQIALDNDIDTELCKFKEFNI